MRRFITIFAFVLLFASCSSKQNQDTTMMYDDGRSKPVVIIAPIIDSTSLDYPWSLSDEFSSYIRNDLSQQGICIAHKDFQDFSYQQNPFENDLSWVKAAFPAEFVVFIEFVEHKQNPVYKRFDNPSEIKNDLITWIVS